MTTQPWTYEPRPETGTTNIRLGIWLFLASEAMFFGSLFSGYFLLRAGSPAWPAANTILNRSEALLLTPILLGATALLAFGPHAARPGRLKMAALGSAFVALLFVGVKLLQYNDKLIAGLLPSTNLLLACWYALTGVHVLHVAGGAAANVWLAVGAGGPPERNRERLHSLRLYWYFVDLVWLTIILSFYLV